MCTIHLISWYLLWFLLANKYLLANSMGHKNSDLNNSNKGFFILLRFLFYYRIPPTNMYTRNTVLKRGVNHDLRRNAVVIRSLTLCGITRGFYSQPNVPWILPIRLVNRWTLHLSLDKQHANCPKLFTYSQRVIVVVPI